MGKVKQWQVDLALSKLKTPCQRIERKLAHTKLFVIDIYPVVSLHNAKCPGKHGEIAWFWGPGRWTRMEKFVDELLLKMRENKE